MRAALVERRISPPLPALWSGAVPISQARRRIVKRKGAPTPIAVQALLGDKA